MARKLRPLEPRNLALVADLELEGAWRVEYFDSDGAGYIAIFAGQSAEVRARDYYDALERGALNTRIADAQVVTFGREDRGYHSAWFEKSLIKSLSQITQQQANSSGCQSRDLCPD